MNLSRAIYIYSTIFRDSLVADRCFFSSSLRRCCPWLGVVLILRGSTTTATLNISDRNLSNASDRLRSWLRCSCDLITITPSLVIRLSRKFKRRSLNRSGSDDVWISNRKWIAVATLLTFWPPAPCDRIALSSISLRGILSVLEIWNIGYWLVGWGNLGVAEGWGGRSICYMSSIE